MKRAILTIGLFSMMMVLTSFNTAAVDNIIVSVDKKQNYDTKGVGASIGAGKKLDVELVFETIIKLETDRGGASIGAGKKLD